MLKIRRVLFPTDFSDTAEEALAQAAEIAHFFSAELLLLHVIPLLRDSSRAFERTHREFVETLEKEAHERIGALSEVPELTLRKIVRRGDAVAPTILEHAAEASVDLIVMATHGRRGLRKWFLGSVAQEVVREADRPVLTLRRREHGLNLDQARRFLVPIDFSEPARYALQKARELAAQTGASLQLLHVIDTPVYPAWYAVSGSGAVAMAERYDLNRLHQRSGQELEDFFRNAPGPDVPFETLVQEGRPADRIVDFSSEGGDLIVMASRGLSGLTHLFLGSVTESVMQRAERPVLILRAEEDRRDDGDQGKKAGGNG